VRESALTVVRVTQVPGSATDVAPVLERERELAAIERLLEHAAAARGQLVAVEGPAGIGKTTLLAAATTLARERGATVLVARGSPLERAFAFGVVRGLFERVAFEPGDGSTSLLSGAARLARPALAAAEAGTGVSREEVSHATLHGLYWLTANVAARAPLLLAIDDCHWADGPSLRYLAHLGARLDGVRALVLVALRSGDAPAQPELVGELAALSTRDAIRPTALGPQAAAELVRATLGEAASDRFCLACHAATGGTPLLLRALVASIATDGREPTDEAATGVASFGAEGVARVLAQQLARLPAGSEPFLRALCILGANPPLRHVTALAGLELAQAAQIADALRLASILSAAGELDFAHPVLRAAITERIGPHERAIAHVRAAELLAAEGAPPERLAAHLLHAHPSADGAVVATLRSAAAVAADRGAPETAAIYLQRALEEPPSPASRALVKLELGLAQLAARIDTEAMSLLTEAVAALDPSERARATLVAGRSLGLVGRFQEAATILESGLASGPVANETELLVEAELIGNASLLAGRAAAALERTARVRSGDAPAGVARDLMLINCAARELRDARPAGAGWALLDRALAAGPLLREESIVVAWAMMALFWTDRLDEAEQICNELVRAGEQRGSAYLVAHLSFPRAFVAARRGELRQAEADARFGLEQKLARGLSDGRAFHLAPLLNALVDQGDLEGAELALARAHVPTRPAEQLAWALVLEARGRLRLAQDRRQEALTDLLDAGKRWESLAWTHPGLTAWRSEAARALARLGEQQQAARLAAEQLELARATRLPRPIGAATLAAAMVTTPRPSLRLLREAADLLERTQAKLELARALVELGAALRRDGKRVAAREQLRRGLELAHRAGARPLAEHARAELIAAGARPRRPVFTGVDALTASELRVARLAADGLTNREIAERLFVTERTVETHLRHVFQKLDISSRLQLPAAFGPSEPTASAR
jgi:DNA-binding CsgD family transcriptional regulator/tetratricopeptide (TPR) repeat protein